MRVVIVTGLAGGGKTTALRALEDLGFFCCDNLPVPMFAEFVERLNREGMKDVAISVDSRQTPFLDEFHKQAEVLRSSHEVEVLFLEAPDAVLLRRYSETRRLHPLSGEDVIEGICQDREALQSLHDIATIINTGGLNVHEIKGMIHARYSEGGPKLAVCIQSFGFKYGLPSDCHLVFDMRHLPNPYFDPVLRSQDGRDRAVAEYVFSFEDALETLKHVDDYLRFTLPLSKKEGKVYVTVGIGCTGGQHRSVAMTEELSQRLQDDWHVVVRHRDLPKATGRS